MKIAIITETFLPNTDGIVTRLCASIEWLKNNGHDVFVIAPDLGVREFKGARVAGLPARRFFLYREKKLAFPNRNVRGLLREFDPDIVHVVNPAVLGVAGVYYGKKLNFPLIASYHTNIPHYADYYKLPFLKPALWWFFRKLHNRADLNLCTSQSVHNELTAQRFHNIHVWKRGVAVERFGSDHFNDDMRSRLTNGQEDKTLLLYVGRLAAEKEIEKIRNVLEASDDFCLAIIGDGPYRAYLEKYFAGTNTVFTGFLHGEELAQAYASSNIFIFPSTTETLGLVLLEAMASGLPVVAAKSGPTCEQIEDGKTGLLYDANDLKSFVNTVTKLKDPHLRSKLSEHAYQTGQEFNWAKASEQLLHFYKLTVNQHGTTNKMAKINIKNSS